MYEEIKTYEDACKALGKEPNTMKVEDVDEQTIKVMMISEKLITISTAIRGGWVPDWQDRSQRKWEPWFDMEEEPNNPTGFRFGVSNCTGTTTNSVLGPLLCQESEAKADYLGRTFVELYREIMKPGK